MIKNSRNTMFMGKVFSVISVALMIASLVFTVLPAQTARAGSGSGSIKTVTGTCGAPVDANQFSIGDVVYLYGSGFDPGTYAWDITGNPGGSSGDPNIVVAHETAPGYVVVSTGVFCFAAYTVQSDDWGTYQVKFGGVKGDNYRVDAPGTASASVVAGTCSWSQANGSQTPVTITISNADLLLNGVHYTASTSINLGPGTYPYSWTAVSGYTGSGSGSLVIGSCTPPSASASVVAGNCGWTQATGSQTPVTITIDHADLLLNGVHYTASTSINLGTGTYPYSWTATGGYIGSGSGSLLIGDCTPGSGSASIVTGICSWSQANGSQTPVTITISNADLLLNGVHYTASTSINLGTGTYPYSWTATGGYIGSGSGSLVIGSCVPPSASASVVAGTCGWTQATGSQTPVTITISNADLLLNGVHYTASTSVNLVHGTYPYSWTAASGYIGSGSGSLVIDDCTPGLSIDKTVTESVYTQAGDVLHYSYLVTNIGNVSLTSVGVTDDKTTVVCPKSTLVPAEFMTCTATYSVKAGDMNVANIKNTAYAAGLFNTSPVQSDPDSATVVRFVNLVLSAACGVDPTTSNGWRVANSNPYQVSFEWAIDGGVSGVGSVAANSTAGFDTPLGSGTGLNSLYVSGVLQNSSLPVPTVNCTSNPPKPPEGPQNIVPPVAPVLIPVTGVDSGMFRRVLPGSLFGLSFSFAGLGMLMVGLARRRQD